MLQQTQVNTVIPYFQRWMRRFPNVRTVASAPLQEVLKFWEGLGYYTRARQLHRAAQILVGEHGGELPSSHTDWLALPGIGPYTAGAICSISFDQPTPILDGNVIRVLARAFGIAHEPQSGEGKKKFWQLAELLVQTAAAIGPGNAGALNEALMELGATICVPRLPHCAECPIRNNCFAFKRDEQQNLPNLARRPKTTSRFFHAFVLDRNNRVLVRQRPARVVNGGLWEFPNHEVGSTDAKVLFKGLPARKFTPITTIRHAITRYRITMQVFRANIGRTTPIPEFAGEWRRIDDLKDLPFPSAHKRIVKLLSAREE